VKSFEFSLKLATFSILKSEESLRNSDYLLEMIYIQNINRSTFKMEKNKKKNRCVTKFAMSNTDRFYIETKSKYFYQLQNLLTEFLIKSNVSSGIKMDIVSKLASNMTLIDSSFTFSKLFKILVIEEKQISEEKFLKIIFDKENHNFSMIINSREDPEGFNNLDKLIASKLKSNKLEINYFIPDVWDGSKRFIKMDESKIDRKQLVQIPDLPTVVYIFRF
jgi:hypothetical protein